MSVNKVILLGFCGKDPEIRHLSDTKVANFSLATTESYKNKNGEKVETVEWHNIVVWRGLAEIVEKYVRKGSQLYIEGKIFTRTWEKDGVKQYRTEIQADAIQMLGSSPEGQQQPPKEESLPTYQSPLKNAGMAAIDEASMNQESSNDDPGNDLHF